MATSWKVLAMFLLCNLAVAAWAADPKGERKDSLSLLETPSLVS